MATLSKILVRKLAVGPGASIQDSIFNSTKQLRVYLYLLRLSRMYFLKNTGYLLIFLCTLSANYVAAQAIIKGTVTDRHQHPIPDASVFVKGSVSGTSTDSAGHFSFSPGGKGAQILVASAVGFKETEKQVQLSDSSVILNFELQAGEKLLDPVVVSAGSFEASDKAKGASLTLMDAVTVAGSGADIANSLRFLPGAQQVGDQEGLFVRGGTSDESKQFIDGALLRNPNYASVPGVPQPARVNPFLFKGILFSSGGYSALYGQALSSALILESVDLPDQSSASLHIFPMSAGVGFQNLARNNKSSFGINSNFNSYALYNKVVSPQQDFFHAPEYIETDANFRMKTGKTGMLKFYTNYSYDHTGIRNRDVDSMALFSTFESKGTNVYNNLSYKERLADKWKMDAVIAYNYNKQHINTHLEDSFKKNVVIEWFPYNRKNRAVRINSNLAQAKVVFTKLLYRNQALRFGVEQFYSNDKYVYDDTLNIIKDNLTALFAEGDVYIAKNIAAKIGARAEYSSFLNEINIAPRISLAYRFNDGGQLNLAYGIFYQKPETIYLIEENNLIYTQAAHYVINYQKKINNRLFRIEAFYKKYKNLVTTEPGITNNGTGYAKGAELFFRDKRTFKNFDYWITYTYLDTKRKYLNYPYELQPNFATPHTASIAVKRYFPGINFNVNLSYAFATGRPYYNIQNDVNGASAVLNEGITNNYSQMNLSFAYLFNMFKKWKTKDFSGIGFGINNVFGTKQVFNYNYSYTGLNKMPVTQPAVRSYYIGLFMSFGIDRRNDFMDEKL